MQIISVNETNSDMVLGKSIYTSEGKLLLSAGMRLIPKFVERLIDIGISSIYIADPNVGTIEINDVINERTRLEAQITVAKVAQRYHSTGSFSDREVKNAVNNIMDELLVNKDILFQLTNLKRVDESDYVFSHSVNVCVLALMTGIAMGHNQLTLQELGTGALLHDIGKGKVPIEILEKPGALCPEEYVKVKEHCKMGFEILRGQDNISTLSSTVAFQHHEYYNGKGYPQGLQGKGIHEYARIVAIADVYDALSSDRVYRKRFLPHEAAEYIQSLGGHQFDPDIVTVFLKNIAVYPPGTLVKLNSGERAVVIGCEKDYPTRPSIRFINPGSINHMSEIALKSHPSIFISQVLE